MGSERSRAGRPTSTEADQLTERLRRAAVDTFLEYGYDGTSMEAVAQAAGITKSTLYARYPDKRSLFIGVSSWALTRQERDQRVLEPLPDDLADGLAVIARAILARSVDPDIVRLSRMAIAESGRFPEFAASSQAVTWSPRIRVIMDLLRRHERAGTVVVKDIELAAEQFFAMVGAMPAWLAAYGIYRTPEVEEQHLLHAVELFVNGVLRRAAPEPAPLPVADGRRATTGSMEYRRLGRSGLSVSQFALGGASLALPGCQELIHRFLDAGGNLLDAGGKLLDATGGSAAAEESCGRAVRGRRSEVVVATRAGMPAGPAPHDGGNSRRRLRAACEASLRRLQTDYIDLYQIDVDDLTTPLEELIDALDDLVRAGKVLYVGAANFHAYRLMKALSVSDRGLSRARFTSLQGEYNPLVRSLELEHFPLLAAEGLGFLSRNPLAAGTVAPIAPPERPGPGQTSTAAVRKAASDLGCTPAQLALAWQRTKPVTSVIIEPRTLAGLEEYLASSSIEIPAQVAAELEAAAPAGAP